MSTIRLQFRQAANALCKPSGDTSLLNKGNTKSYAQVATLVSPPKSGALKRDGNTGKRPNPLTIRLTEKQRKSIKAKAQAARITVNQYAKAALLDSEYRPPLPPELRGQLLDLYRELTRHGTNLNQIARQLNTGTMATEEASDALGALKAELRETYQAVCTALANGRPQV